LSHASNLLPCTYLHKLRQHQFLCHIVYYFNILVMSCLHHAQAIMILYVSTCMFMHKSKLVTVSASFYLASDDIVLTSCLCINWGFSFNRIIKMVVLYLFLIYQSFINLVTSTKRNSLIFMTVVFNLYSSICLCSKLYILIIPFSINIASWWNRSCGMFN
jgi:hypothetical protein